MVKVVIAGGSFGGLTTAFELKRLLNGKVDVTVLCDEEEFVFMPSLPWVAMGWKKPSDITLSLRKILTPKGINFVHSAVETVNPEKSVVKTKDTEFQYDYFVIATGPFLAFEDIPGLGPDKGHTECIFTLKQAEKANKAWNKFLEGPGPVVVGSVQGVSCFGPPYEYAFEIDTELGRRKIRHKVPITFVTSEPYIGHFGIGGLKTSRRVLEDEFANRDIKIIANQAVEEFTPGEAKLKDGTKLPYKLSMFAPAFKGVSAVAPLGNPRGFIPVDKNYRHTKYSNILAIGVAMAIAPPEQTPVPTGVPKTGYMTVEMAKDAARTIVADITGMPVSEPEPLGVLCLVDLGDSAVLAKAKPLLPPRQEAVWKKGIIYKWGKHAFERYFLWKMKNGLTQLP